MLRRITLPFLVMLVALFITQNVQAQNSQQDKIQRRLDEVGELLAEESNTITLLEKQLETAVVDNDDDRIERLQDEVSSTFERVEELEDLEKQLKKLLKSAGGSTTSKGRRRGGRAPQPAMGGPVPGERSGSGAREKDDSRPMGIAGADVSDKDLEEVRDRAGIGREKKPVKEERDDRSRRGSRTKNGDRGTTVAENKVKNLRDAMTSLEAAGEFGMARSVESLIRKAEDKLDQRQEARDREEATRRDRDRSRARDNERDDNASRPRLPVGGNNGGPITADGPSSRDRQPARNSRDGSGSSDSEFDELKERLEKLRERTKRDRGGN